MCSCSEMYLFSTGEFVGDEDDYVRHRNGNGGEKEGRVVMMMEAEIVM